jgi:hypothetical protein
MLNYLDYVLEVYTLLPDTPSRPRPADRMLARQLAQQHVPLALVIAAILLGNARREGAKHPLGPIRSLYYFLPILEELQREQVDPAYLDYLERRSRAILGRKSAVTAK